MNVMVAPAPTTVSAEVRPFVALVDVANVIVGPVLVCPVGPIAVSALVR